MSFSDFDARHSASDAWNCVNLFADDAAQCVQTIGFDDDDHVVRSRNAMSVNYAGY